MRAVRLLSAFAVAGVLTLSASPAGAQSTTTIPPVRSIPVTGGQTATTTTAAPTATTARPSGDTAAGAGLAETGLAADLLVPFALTLIGGGAVLQAVSRRRSVDYGLL